MGTAESAGVEMRESGPTEDETTFRPIDGWPKYEVNALGDVRSNHGRTPRILSWYIDRDGYRKVSLFQNGLRKTVKVHTAVAAAWLGPRPAGMVVRHIYGDPSNPALSGLRWGTQSDNAFDYRRHIGLENKCDQSHEYTSENTYIAPSGKRACRTCRRAWYLERRRTLSLAA